MTDIFEFCFPLVLVKELILVFLLQRLATSHLVYYTLQVFFP